MVRVNNEQVLIGPAMTSLDYAWHTLHVGRHLIHMSLIDQEIHARGIEVSEEELDEVLLRFRWKRWLLTREQVERWMLEHGTTEAQLEGHLRDEWALWVMQFLPGRFDEATRRKIADRLFDAWLEEKRRSARVEWFWGAAEAAPLPAMSL